VVDDADTVPDPHRPGRRSPDHGAMAMALDRMNKLVFSRTMLPGGVPAWSANPREIETMKRQPGKDMILFGSGSIVSQLTRHGLIDEYPFAVCPIFLGKGQPLLTGVSKHGRLDLLEAKALPSGDVMLRYARRH